MLCHQAHQDQGGAQAGRRQRRRYQLKAVLVVVVWEDCICMIYLRVCVCVIFTAKIIAICKYNYDNHAFTTEGSNISVCVLCHVSGGKNSNGCTLILTEGDSAKTLAVSGLGVVGRDRYGVFPLRGKMLNVREATHKQVR